MENENTFLQTFSEIEFEPRPKRERCTRCGRPASVCLCQHLPKTLLDVKRTTLHILQHPNEEYRPLNTVAILSACLPPNVLNIYKGKKFTPSSYKNLHAKLHADNTFLLFPCPEAVDLKEVECYDHYNIVLLDGTWKQASSIYCQNKFLKRVKKVKLSSPTVSEYVIRTQPDDASLSTLECAAIALEHTEQNKQIKQELLKPLRALCQIQLDHGAVVHQSKELVASNNKPKEKGHNKHHETAANAQS